MFEKILKQNVSGNGVFTGLENAAETLNSGKSEIMINSTIGRR